MLLRGRGWGKRNEKASLGPLNTELTGTDKSNKKNSSLLTINRNQIFISVFNQLDAKKICFTISFISCLYMFRAHVLIIRRSKLHYTASGIITAIGGRLVHIQDALYYNLTS